MKKLFIIFFILIFPNFSYANRICGTPNFHNEAVWASKNLKFRPLTIEELRAKGKLSKSGEILFDQQNETRSFYAYNFQTNTYYQINATCQKVGTYCYIYIEQGQNISSTTINNIANEFDTKIYSTNKSIFGDEPNIDADPRITILILDIKDNYPASYVAGYFDPKNQYPKNTYSTSNEREMFYMDCNPLTPGSNEFYAILAHEFQHMIHFNMDVDEDTWLNEGCSMYSEVANNYGIPWGHINAFVDAPDTSLTIWNGALANYGASFLFIFYLYEKYGGNSTIKTLVGEKENGTRGVTKVLSVKGYSKNFSDVFTDWTIANYIDDTVSSSGIYGYNSIDLSCVFTSYNSYPIASTSATVNYWATDYFKLTTPSAGTLKLSFNGNDDNTFKVKIVKSTSNFTIGTNTIEEITLNAVQDGTWYLFNFGSTYQSALMVVSSQSETGTNPPSYTYSAELFTSPSTPSALKAVAGDSQIELSWNASIEGTYPLLGYNVYRSTTSGSGYAKVNTQIVTTNYYLDNKNNSISGPVNGTTYYYVVKSLDNQGNESEYSNEVAVVPESPVAPTKVYNYPNPMESNGTTFRYNLTIACQVNLEIYDTSGTLLTTIYGLPGNVGWNEYLWYGTTSSGRELSNGVYIYRIVMNTGSVITTKENKVLILK